MNQIDDKSEGALPTARATAAEPVVSALRDGIANAIVLVRADDPDKKPLLYACAKCGTAHSPAIYLATEERKHLAAREAAEDCYQCRTHNNCDTCGCETPKGWMRCDSCRFKARLEAAVEVPDDGGPYCAFDGDEYFSELDQAADASLEWVSPCTVTYPRLDADDILDNLLSDMFEDASVDDLDGVTEFYAAIEAFNKAQRTPTYFGDNKRKIRVPAQGTSAGTDETVPGSGLQPAGPVGATDAPNPQDGGHNEGTH